MKKNQSTLIMLLATTGFFVLLLFLEQRRPLRQSVDDKKKRADVDIAMAVISAGFLFVVEQPIARRLTSTAERKRVGLLWALPPWPRWLIGLLLLDYTIYIWHVLLHKVPLLWRFHIAHHTDRDLDVFTSLRFHFGELLLSVIWRSAQILIIGVPDNLLALWQSLFALSIMFHHSNVRLPEGLEKALNWFIVSPRLHGIHHSQVERDTNSNWSSGLTIWDRLHRTFRGHTRVPVVIGTHGYSGDGTRLLSTLILPLEPRPAGGSE